MADHGFHHGQMLKVVMGLEQSVSRVKLYQDTANAPDITWERPAQPEDNFRRTIMPSAHNR